MITITDMRIAISRSFGFSLGLLFMAVCSAAWGQAGYVHQVSGLVTIQKSGEKAQQTKVGDTFDASTEYRSGADGKVTLKFADGQVVALSPDSAVRVGQYRYDPANPPQSSSTVQLLQGEMRFVAGLIGASNSAGTHLSAGDTLISIVKSGGVDFTVGVKPGTEEVGYAVVARGEISARTPYGPITRVEAGQYAPWQPGREPRLPIPFAAAPAVVQAAVGASWITLVPSSTPVDVAAAGARTAAVAATPAPGIAGESSAPTESGGKFAGYVAAISNSGTIRSATGGITGANVGTTFQAGATFSTGNDGTMTLKFADGQVVILGANSNLAVTQYQFDPANAKASKSAIDLVSGTMRLVTGVIQAENRDGMNISAGVSIINVISDGPADFKVAVDDGKREREVGIAKVTLGEIAVHTPYGPIDRIKKDESAPWGPKTRPEIPVPLATGLALVESIVALQTPKAPDTEPVAVEEAARAAGAVAAAAQAQAAANANPGNTQLQAAAKAAAEFAAVATQAAATASQAISAAAFASALTNLPATAAGPGPTLVQVAAGPTATTTTATPSAAAATAPITPAVTPTGGGGCLGSKC